jgi:cytochrome c oxidase subunit 3
MMAQIQQDNDRINLSAKRFNMWIFIFVSFMLFAAFSSGFIVYAGGKGHGLNVILPKTSFIQHLVLPVAVSRCFWHPAAAKAAEYGRCSN